MISQSQNIIRRVFPAILVIVAVATHTACNHDPVQKDSHFHSDGESCDSDHSSDHPADDGHEHANEQEGSGHTEDDHEEHDPGPDEKDHTPFDHEHDASEALEISGQAKANIGLELAEVKLQPFQRTISVPATVVQRPGKSQIHVTATFTGLVKQIYCIEGETVTPGMPLFDLQLTHEELVQAQAELLRLAAELEFVNYEVERLTKVAAGGAIAGKSVLSRQFEQKKLQAMLQAQRQRLLLHRLTEEQVDGILKNRQLVQFTTIKAPSSKDESPDGQPQPVQVQKLVVEQGQHVSAGDLLCVLADHAELDIQGRAFEQDIPVLARAAKSGWPVTAVFQTPDTANSKVAGLRILYLASDVDMKSRAFRFYVRLPNELVRDTKTDEGGRFIDWQFKPGQRLRLQVPTEPAVERIVLPVEAVVTEGVEAFVFEYNQGHFDRRNVIVTYRDQDRAVVANDGSLKPGVKIAAAGAYQIYLDMKKKEGKGVDPHAGHHH